LPDEDYEETPLYGGDTRPAVLKWVGLPLTVAAPLVMAVPMIMNLIAGWRSRFVAFGMLVVVAVFFWWMHRHDHNALRILARWLHTKFKSFDARKWKGATPDPFPFRPSKTPHGIFDD
jgi:type IV secretory pathway VirB3-like protein